MTSAFVSWKGTSLYCRVMDTFFSHLKGLMFSRRLQQQEGLLFLSSPSRKIDIHMLFVFFSIDAVWLDQHGRVVQITRWLKPFTPFVEGTMATYLLEVDAGVADDLHVGDQVTIKLKRKTIS